MASVSEMTPDADGVCPNLDREDAVVKNGGKSLPWPRDLGTVSFDPRTNALVDDMTSLLRLRGAHCNHICAELATAFFASRRTRAETPSYL